LTLTFAIPSLLFPSRTLREASFFARPMIVVVMVVEFKVEEKAGEKF